ncbi:sensor histidine kinase [Sinimarinibacterium sp. CAU 1509]|uniref:sensor histidine kinase n=1 Tax=Sinimarinibacterium sp. CAU 1509 TaxID=2562283 RepID=UPI00200A3BAA|nr:sensor histidine kinase [Sinimarinibacterium sp. CAU 1509]
MTPVPEPSPPPISGGTRETEADDFRRAVLQQVEALTADNQRLLQSVVRSERRFRTLAKSVWHVQEEERRRLARELHDGIGQTLTALANQVQRILDDARGAGNLGLEHRLGDALDLTRSALHDTRELSRLLRPTLLDDLGLDAALNWLARTLSERTGLDIELQSALDERRLHPDVETLVFRITQEALTNVIRHACAQSARIVLALKTSALVLRIEDDGSGFDTALLTAAERSGTSSGVRGMRDRAELFGGSIELRSAPGRGTVVQLTLVLDASDASPPING